MPAPDGAGRACPERKTRAARIPESSPRRFCLGLLQETAKISSSFAGTGSALISIALATFPRAAIVVVFLIFVGPSALPAMLGSGLAGRVPRISTASVGLLLLLFRSHFSSLVRSWVLDEVLHAVRTGHLHELVVEPKNENRSSQLSQKETSVPIAGHL